MNVSIIDPAFIGSLGVSAVITSVAALRLGRHVRARTIVWLVAALLAVAAVASAVNGYFAYFPTVNALFGRAARDQRSAGAVSRVVATRAAAPSAPPLPARGVVEQVDIPATVSGFHPRPAEVYLPPAWFARRRPQLPVVEMLHGTPGAPQDWTRAAGADVTADAWAAAHGGYAPILVFPDINGSFFGDTECVDGAAGRAETYLTVDVPAWVEAHLGALSSRSGWAVVGLSEGGYCALDLALRHQDRYAALGDLSGLDHPTYSGGVLRLFRGSTADVIAHTPAVLLRRGRPRLPLWAWFSVGSDDGSTTRQVQQAAELASRAGLDAHLDLLPGGHHTWRVWRDGFAHLLPALADKLAAAVPPSHTILMRAAVP